MMKCLTRAVFISAERRTALNRCSLPWGGALYTTHIETQSEKSTTNSLKDLNIVIHTLMCVCVCIYILLENNK